MHGSAPVRQKSLLRFFMGGSVDDGKSTLIDQPALPFRKAAAA